MNSSKRPSRKATLLAIASALLVSSCLSSSGNNPVDGFFGSTGNGGTASNTQPMPANFTVTGSNATSISFTWTDEATTETGIDIQRCDGAACSTTFTVSDSISVAAGTTSYTWNSLVEGQVYTFRLRSDNGSVSSGWLVSPMILAFGGIQSVKYIAGSTAQINWNSIPGAALYTIINITGGTSTTVTSVTSNYTSYTLMGLSPSTTYKFRVRVITSAGYVDSNTTSSTFTTGTENHFLYTMLTSSPYTLDTYSVDQTSGVGTLLGSTSLGTTSYLAITQHPSKKFVLGWNSNVANVYLYEVNASTGALTSVTWSTRTAPPERSSPCIRPARICTSCSLTAS